ncbi:MAG: colicin import rane protein [Baekduia sp.]|nr:colicin import rane protein [Baekduia sp.]
MKKFLTLTMVVLAALSLASTASAATAGQRNALTKANSYLSLTAFSKSGLKKQLKYEGFSNSDAGWAVNHVRVSWNAQAVKKAKSYLSLTSFSKSGLIDQLEYDGFTHSQAVYGVNRAYH